MVGWVLFTLTGFGEVPEPLCTSSLVFWNTHLLKPHFHSDSWTHSSLSKSPYPPLSSYSFVLPPLGMRSPSRLHAIKPSFTPKRIGFLIPPLLSTKSNSLPTLSSADVTLRAMEVLINWVNPAPTIAPMVRPSLGDVAPTTLEPWLTSTPKFFKVASST